MAKRNMFNQSVDDDISTIIASQKAGNRGQIQSADTGKKKKKSKNSAQIMQSTQSFSPIADVRNGIIVTKDFQFLSMVEVAPINFGMMGPADQDAVIGQFEAALQVLPKNAQFKCISRTMNVDDRVEWLEKCFSSETNENCRAMQSEQIQLIRSASKAYGISRRFFVIFRYQPEDTSLKSVTSRIDWDTVSSQLNRQRAQFEANLRNCGNAVISTAYDDEYTLRTLYDILHPYYEDVGYVSFTERVRMVAQNHMGEEGRYVSCNDILAYDRVSTKNSSFVQADNLYRAVAYITADGYARHVYAGWVASLIQLAVGIDVDVFITKENKEAARQKLTYALRFNVMSDKELDETSAEKDELRARLQSGFYLKNKLASPTDEFCYINVFLTLTAFSEEEMKSLMSRLKRHCKGMNMPIQFCRFQQEKAFLTTMPVCKMDNDIYKKCRRNLMMSDAASSYPFVSFELNDKNGIMFGRNLSNQSLAIVDNFNSDQYANGNMVICGTSGSGKTYSMSCLCMRMREMGTQVFIISPVKGFEFIRCSAAVGGTYINIAPGSTDNINVMEIRKRDNAAALKLYGREDSQLIRKIQSIHRFFSLLSEIDPVEDQVLDDALVRTYGKFGITEDNESLYDPINPGRYRKMPILGDLYNELKALGEPAKRLCALLSRFIVGSARSFNAPTNVDLDNKFIALDVSYASDDMKSLCMFIATDFVWDKCQADTTQKKVIALDEVWQLIGVNASKQVANFVLDIFKLIRGYGGMAIAATQDFSDFFSKTNGDIGKAIVNSSELKLILKLKKQEAEFTKSVIALSDPDIDRITNKFQRGDALLMAGLNNVFIHIEAGPTEHSIITTRRDELEQQVAKKTKNVTS